MILGFIAAAFVAFFVLLDEGPGSAIGALCLLGILFGAVGALIISLPATYIMSDDYIETHEIVSLKDGTGSTGSFFLGSGSLDGDATFFYYQRVSGGFELKSVDADDTTIIFSDENPRVEQDCTKFNNNFFTWPVAEFPTDHECEGDYKIYVPADSITTKFVLDAE